MSETDRIHWDARYRDGGPAPVHRPSPPPPILAHLEHVFPRCGSAIDVACGRGRAAVWLAKRGLEVWGIDVSLVAIDHARTLAEASGVAALCRFDVVDLDDGLPDGPPVDLVLCHLYRDARLDRPIIDRLRAGGMLAIACLSEVDSVPGPFRAKRGELVEAFAELELIEAGESGGRAWLLGRRSGEVRRLS